MELSELAKHLGQKLLAQKLMLVTAESCTGGWVAETVTSVAGSSEWFERGFITYSNLAKQEMLGVKAETLKQFGAVSEQTAREMAEGALQHSHADIAVSVTGIAGPSGGTNEKPTGTVWFSLVSKHFAGLAKEQYFTGDRQAIRRQAVEFVLEESINWLSQGGNRY